MLSLDVAIIAQSVIVLLILGGITGVFKFIWNIRDDIRDVRDELRSLNGKVGKIEIKIADHERLDDTRFATVLRDLSRLEGNRK